MKKLGLFNTKLSEGMIQLKTVSCDSKVFFKSIKSKFFGRYVRIEQTDLEDNVLTIFNINEDSLKEMLSDVKKIKL